ncbi:hypothetical protein BJV82DRAFT_623490 [Fennellomyces sp. T-0311]|nr:hypothetical protein BJV82DRAFT_623490 [Fennellomyces sp. T-0311]
MGGKDCPKFEKAKANPLPDNEDATPNKCTRRMRNSLDQDLGSLPGMMSHVHLGDPLQKEFIAIGHRGSHHRRRGHSHSGPDDEHNQSDTPQEEYGSDTQRRTRVGKLGVRSRRGPKHIHQLNGAGTCKGRMDALNEILSGRSENHGLLAHHMRRIHHHHYKHKEAAATIEILLTALRDEIARPCKRRRGHRGSAYHGHYLHNHHHSDHLKSGDDDVSEANQEVGDTSSSEQSCHHMRANERYRNAVSLAHIYHHRRLGHLHAHAFKSRGKGNYGKRSAVSLATPDILPRWPTYDIKAFGRHNRYHNHRELFNDVQRDAILIGGRAVVMHGRHRRFMHGHHHKFMGLR